MNSMKKGRFSVFNSEANSNNKEIQPFFLDGFDLGMEFKSYFPQSNFRNVLKELNIMIELNSPIHQSKIKAPRRRLFQKKKIY